MARTPVALTTIGLALAVPAAHAFASKPAPRTVAQSLLRQMNATADGRITRRVTCARAADRLFGCSLESVAGTTLNARVVVTRGGAFRATWLPLRG